MDVDRLTPTRLRQLAILPLVFFLAQGIHYWQIDQLGQMLWMCNIGGLVLAVGMFLDKPVVIRVAALWTVPGVAVWFMYYVMPNWRDLFNGMFGYSELFGILASTLAHIGGFIIGMIVLKRIKVDRLAWIYAFGWYFVVQLLARLVTPVDQNVNLSHSIQPGWEQTFGSYWKFWLVLTVTTGVSLCLLGLLLSKLWPVRMPSVEANAAASEAST